MNKNPLDLLRLMAAAMVLFSHQCALLRLAEPSFMGWNSFDDAGVTILFFLSGYLVWSSWDRDPHIGRFFRCRSLRIFPTLWAVCLLSIFALGPLLTVLPVGDYVRSSTAGHYMKTAFLVSPNTLPGLHLENSMPAVVSGALSTLPMEFLCYATVAAVDFGATTLKNAKGAALGLCLLGAMVVASYGPLWVGTRFVTHLEMVALFWWRVFYGYCLTAPKERLGLVLAADAVMSFAMLMCAALPVHLARNVTAGARLTDGLGDLSNGVYIFAFPVQQIGVPFGSYLGWSFTTYFSVSLMVTFALAYAPWHGVEKQALRFKPASRGST